MNTLTNQFELLEAQDYTPQEKLCILRFSNMIAAADGKVHQGEIKFMVDLIEKLNLPISSPLDANSLSFEDVAATIKRMTITKKNKAFVLFRKMIESDGEVHKREVKIFHRLKKVVDPNNILSYK
ncbi:TerB family tellurite resistance protein [Flammeovirga sp. MY04]|uniref:tellurite resistance TerB family protein n=1 Tax=Flammeovirga sp. MY04 TaxID=1191459 RepID=UPI0008060917|nr:TerB family tellurite resistance protein [Flammeovirga sp. MY04]ANQ52507.1 TerB family tellurite resistance protein [Flammeovirga sp. MY04]